MIKNILYKYTLRVLVTIYFLLLSVISLFFRKKRARRDKLEVLVTGTFYSDNWLITHLKPLAMSEQIDVVQMVSVRQVPEIENVEAIYPSEKMQKIIGEVPARLLLFSWLAIKNRPDIVAGFHLLLNGLFAILLAKIAGARSLYICGGGPREVVGGGYNTESKIFNKLKSPDDYIESILLKSVNKCDYIISMGTGAVDYFKANGVTQQFEIVPGGFDEDHFSAGDKPKKYDLILIGRLSKVKRVDIFLKAIKIASKRYESLNAVIVGDGPDIEKLKRLSDELEIGARVDFVGWQTDVAQWMQQSRLFVLTSESEGLSQALIQAMMAGLPAVVTDVGDLSDLVVDHENGFLISDLNPNKFADAFITVLSSEKKYIDLSDNAYDATRKFSYLNVSKNWDQIFEKIPL